MGGITEDQVRDVLRKRAAKYAKSPHPKDIGLNAWCREHNVERGHASEFLSGKRHPSTALLDALGLEYRIVRKARKP